MKRSENGEQSSEGAPSSVTSPEGARGRAAAAAQPLLAPKARASRANRSKRSESGERSPGGAASRVSSPEGAASHVPRGAAAGRGARDEPKAKSQATVQYIYI